MLWTNIRYAKAPAELQFRETINQTKFCKQSRSDRDNYVEIIWANIPNDKQHNFNKYSSAVVNHFNLRYDFEVHNNNNYSVFDFQDFSAQMGLS